MHASFMVIDDFYDNPHEVRRIALGMDYPEPEIVENFPGRNSAQIMEVGGLDQGISRIVNEPLIAFKENPSSHGRFRVSLAGEDANRRSNVHSDVLVNADGNAPALYWSGIVYLTLPEHCQGGTEFYRHKPTGMDRAPLYEQELKEFGAASYPEAADRIMNADSKDPDKWEHLLTIPMRFNRLVLLRPWMWHTAGISFGDNKENGRLVQLFFFAINPQAQQRPG